MCINYTIRNEQTSLYAALIIVYSFVTKPGLNIMTFDDLDLDLSVVGLAGSPTKVHATFTKEVSAETKTYELSAQETAELIAKTLKEKQLITK